MNSITAQTLNEVCSKDLSIPLMIFDSTTDDVVNLLKLDHRVVEADDLSSLLRESNSYVVVVNGVEKLEQGKAYFDLFDLIVNTRWRKAVIFPMGSRGIGEHFANHCLRVKIDG